MVNVRFFLDNLWRWKIGVPEKGYGNMPDLDKLRKSQWSNEFESLIRNRFERMYDLRLSEFFTYARNRMLMGAFRYGIVGTDNSTSHDHLSSVPKRYKKFHETYNPEYLYDIYNFMMLQWIDTGKQDSQLIGFAVSCIRLYLTEYAGLKFESIDDGDFHSELKIG